MGQPPRDPEPPPLGLVLEFMRRLWALNHELDATSKRMAAIHGVTGPQRLVLRIVGRRPGISAGDLAQVMELHPSTLTGILRRLEARQLLSRKRDTGDRRRALFMLTSKGRTINELKEGTVESAIGRALRGLPETKVRVGEELLETLTAALRPGRER